jgi:predicted dehydrogenase
MIAHPGLQAVVIGTATSVHAEEAVKAIEKNLHVLCEKPLSISVDIVRFLLFFPFSRYVS